MLKLKTEVAVGMMVMGALILTTFLVFGISGIYYFRPGYQINALFNFVGIIDQGAPVRYAGVKVGEVKKVEIIEGREAGKGNVKVTFFVVKDLQIHEKDKVSVQGTYVMSEPHIAIDPAQAEPGRLLQDGDTIKGVDPVALDDLVMQGKEITEKVNRFLTDMQNSVGDPQTQKALRDSFINIAKLMASLNKVMEGKEDEISSGLSSLSRSADQLSLALEKINSGQGTMGKLLTQDELYNEMRDFVSEIKKHPWRLFKK